MQEFKDEQRNASASLSNSPHPPLPQTHSIRVFEGNINSNVPGMGQTHGSVAIGESRIFHAASNLSSSWAATSKDTTAGYFVTVRLASKGAKGQTIIDGLSGETRVGEVLLLAAVALGVQARGNMVFSSESLMLLRWTEETLAEAAVTTGVVLNLCIGEGGGVLGTDSASIFAPTETTLVAAPSRPDQASGNDEDLAGTVRGFLGQLSRDESGIEVAMQRLHAVQHRVEATSETGMAASDLGVDKSSCLEVERLRYSEAEAVWHKKESDQWAPAEAANDSASKKVEAKLRAQVQVLGERLETETLRYAEAEAMWREERQKLCGTMNALAEAAEAGVPAEAAQLRSGSEQVQQASAFLLKNTSDSERATSLGQQERYSEADEDRELVDDLFVEIDQDKSGNISHEELSEALKKRGLQTELREILLSLLPAGSASERQEKINLETFRKVVEKLPRVRGELVSWARSLRLEEHLAWLIARSRRGDLLDGLKGLKEPELLDCELESFVEGVVNGFAAVLQGVILSGLRQLRDSGRSTAKSHVNTKFALDGAYVGQFATLEDFYRGPEALIGTPNSKVMEGLEAEHCRRKNASAEFTTPNYNLTTTPIEEWEFVVCPREKHRYAHTPKDKKQWPDDCGWKGEEGRDVRPLDDFMVMKEVKRAGLQKAEVIGLRLYTGPTYILYNARLRGFPDKEVALLNGNDYETTIFIIASGITKLSKVTGIPVGRLLYRGLGGMILPRQFWEEFEECCVTLAVSAVAAAELSLEMIRQRLAQLCEAEMAATTLEVGSKFLLLDLKGEAAKLAAGKAGIRVVKAPHIAISGQNTVRIVLSLPLSQFDLTDSILKELVTAMVAACGGPVLVRVEDIANKPFDFKGGGTFAPIFHHIVALAKFSPHCRV